MNGGTPGVQQPAAPGSDLTYLHDVAVSRDTPVPDGLDSIDVAAGVWAVFRTVEPA